MLGFRFLKSVPTRYVMLFKNGTLRRKGAGASFWYFAPTSTLVSVDIGSIDVPFVFEQTSRDFQDLTIQGQITYRVADPERLVKMLNFAVDAQGRYSSEDPERLNERLVELAQKRTHQFAQNALLQELLFQSDDLSAALLADLRQSELAAMLGIELLSVAVLAIKATPEMAKAMQAEAREQLLLRADQAVYARRNTAIELERQLKENELNTERAVEEKRREVREAQMQADVAIEQQRAELVDQQVANHRKLAEAQNEALRATLDAMKGIDWRTLASASGSNDAKRLIAMAFQQIAENAQKIGTLDISPDLLTSLVNSQAE